MKRLRKGDDKSTIKPSMVAVLVLESSDGNRNHAVTVHGGYIYDSNEEIAIPFCKKALDYCCSTEELKAEFAGFWKGWIFQYLGTKRLKVEMMSQPALQCQAIV